MGGFENESVRKVKFETKIFFSDNAEWSSNNLWKMVSVDVKANKTTRIKDLVALSFIQIFIRSTFRYWDIM